MAAKRETTKSKNRETLNDKQQNREAFAAIAENRERLAAKIKTAAKFRINQTLKHKFQGCARGDC